MKIGLQISKFTWPGEPDTIRDTLRDIAQTAEKGGFYSLWVMDHFFQIQYIGPPEDPMLEGYTTLGFLAGVTEKVKLGTLVAGVIYRYPALLVKTVTTLDVISGGRAYFGVGAAWNEEESNALGVRFPPLKIRFEQLEDTLLLARQMWKDNDKPFKGKQLDIPRPLNHPRPVSKPRPPILIGGGGEKKTLLYVAKYGDACNLFARMGYDELKRKIDILKDHCKTVGRTFADIEITALDNLEEGYDPKEVIERYKKLRELGITHIMLGMRNMHEITPVEKAGQDIIPRVSSL